MRPVRRATGYGHGSRPQDGTVSRMGVQVVQCRGPASRGTNPGAGVVCHARRRRTGLRWLAGRARKRSGRPPPPGGQRPGPCPLCRPISGGSRSTQRANSGTPRAQERARPRPHGRPVTGGARGAQRKAARLACRETPQGGEVMGALPRRCLGRCGRLIPAGQSYCDACKPARPWARPGWTAIRDRAIREHPYCSDCGSTSRLEVDHVVPLADGGAVAGPTRVLCHDCHVRVTNERRRARR